MTMMMMVVRIIINEEEDVGDDDDGYNNHRDDIYDRYDYDHLSSHNSPRSACLGQWNADDVIDTDKAMPL